MRTFCIYRWLWIIPLIGVIVQPGFDFEQFSQHDHGWDQETLKPIITVFSNTAFFSGLSLFFYKLHRRRQENSKCDCLSVL